MMLFKIRSDATIQMLTHQANCLGWQFSERFILACLLFDNSAQLIGMKCSYGKFSTCVVDISCKSIFPVGNIAEKVVCRSILTILHCIFSAELTKTHSFRLFLFGNFAHWARSNRIFISKCQFYIDLKLLILYTLLQCYETFQDSRFWSWKQWIDLFI